MSDEHNPGEGTYKLLKRDFLEAMLREGDQMATIAWSCATEAMEKIDKHSSYDDIKNQEILTLFDFMLAIKKFKKIAIPAMENQDGIVEEVKDFEKENPELLVRVQKQVVILPGEGSLLAVLWANISALKDKLSSDYSIPFDLN